ncbi:hypothetical protein CREGCYN_07820 [Synechococcus sp. M16CYN]
MITETRQAGLQLKLAFDLVDPQIPTNIIMLPRICTDIKYIGGSLY